MKIKSIVAIIILASCTILYMRAFRGRWAGVAVLASANNDGGSSRDTLRRFNMQLRSENKNLRAELRKAGVRPVTAQPPYGPKLPKDKDDLREENELIEMDSQELNDQLNALYKK